MDEAKENALWQLADRLRGRGIPRSAQDLLAFQAEARGHGVQLTPRELLEFFGRGAPEEKEGIAPPLVSRFAAAYFEPAAGVRLLDPWAGTGVLVSEVADALQVEEAVAITPNPQWYELAQALGSQRVRWLLGEPLDQLDELGAFDLVISASPFGLKRERRTFEVDGRPVEINDLHERLVMASAALHLSPLGQAMFLVPDGFFFQKQSLWHRLPELGFHPLAAIALPSRSLAPLTEVAVSLLLLSREPQTQLFIGQIDDAHLDEVVANLRARREGPRLELGRLVDPASFEGFSSYADAEQLEIWARRAGLQPLRLHDVCDEISFFDRNRNGFADADNAVYVSTVGVPKNAAATDAKTLRTSPENCVQLVLNPQRALAEYVSGFFNSERGQMLRRSWSGGATIQRFSRSGLEQRYIYLPDLARQAEIVRMSDSTRGVRARLEQIEDALWETPEELPTLRDELAAHIADEKRWIDDLPFPLASILWRYNADREAREKSEHLMHFFEALASFTATLLVSAFHWDESTFNSYRPGWEEIRSLRHASFGGWVKLHSEIAKTVREMLSTPDGERLALELFRTGRRGLIDSLVNPEVDALYRVTLDRRNRGPGHGGIAGPREFERRLEQLEGDLARFRELMGGAFRGYLLLRAGTSRKRGQVNYQSANSLMGSARDFVEIEVETLEQMDDDGIYLFDPVTRLPLPIVPFLQIRHAPMTEENACYFYNAVESNDSVQLVSYHFEREATIDGPEPELVTLVNSLSRRAAAGS
jgi:hypothetical protein